MTALGTDVRTSIGRRARMVVVITCVAVLAAACGSDDDTATGPSSSGDGVAGGVFRVPIGEPAAIDPYNVRESEGNNVAKTLFVGLVSLDESKGLALQPGRGHRVVAQRRLHPVELQAPPEPVQQRRGGHRGVVHPGLDPHRRCGVGVPGRLPPVRRPGLRRAPRRPPDGHHLLRAVGPRPPDPRGEPQRRRLRVRQAHRADRVRPDPRGGGCGRQPGRSTRRPSATAPS